MLTVALFDAGFVGVRLALPSGAVSGAMGDAPPNAAEALKNAGNLLFQAGRFHEAVEKYNDAIELNPEVPSYYTNRAFCHIKMENHGLAIADATVALELDRSFVKAYYRRGSAFMALGKYKDALKDFKAVKQLKPNDKDALAKVRPITRTRTLAAQAKRQGCLGKGAQVPCQAEPLRSPLSRLLGVFCPSFPVESTPGISEILNFV